MALDFRERFPDDVASSLPVYGLQEPGPPTAAIENLTGMAHQFGLQGTAHETAVSGEWTIHREGLAELAVHELSGALFYRKRGRYGYVPEQPYDIDDASAERAANQFLGQVGLLREERSGAETGEDSAVLGVTHLRLAGGSVEGGQTTEQVLDSGVVYGRVVDGLPVEGPGGEMMVNVDAKAEVFALKRVWRPIAKKEAEVRVLPPERAYDAMEKIAKRLKGDVVVTKARFGYFEHGYTERQAYLQPAYSMVYVVTDGEVSFKSAEVVHAGDKEFEALHREKKHPGKRQPKRKPDRQ